MKETRPRLPIDFEAVSQAVSTLPTRPRPAGSGRREVVVFGSAPVMESPFRSAATIGIFVNGALERTRAVNLDSSIWILSSPLLNVGLSQTGLDRFVSVAASLKAREIESLECDLVIVVSDESKEHVDRGIEALKVRVGRVIVLPPTVTSELAFSLLGWNWFLKSISSWYVIRRLLGSFRKPIASASLASFRLPGNLRPSTGVFAMVLASCLFPLDEKKFYGISIADSLYQIGGKKYDFKGEPGNSVTRPRNHLPADAEILRELQRRYEWSCGPTSEGTS